MTSHPRDLPLPASVPTARTPAMTEGTPEPLRDATPAASLDVATGKVRPRRVLRADARLPDLADLPAAPPLDPGIHDTGRAEAEIPRLLALQHLPPQPPRRGVWGASTLAIVAGAVLCLTWITGTRPMPDLPPRNAGPVDMPVFTPDPIEVIIATEIVPPETLPLQIVEMMAAERAAAVAPEDPPEAAEAVAAETVEDVIPVVDVPPPPAPPTPEEADPAPKDDPVPETSPQEAPPEETLPPHMAAEARDGVALAAFAIEGAGLPDLVQAWLAASLAEVRLKTTNGDFTATFGAGGLAAEAEIVRTPAVAVEDIFVRVDGAPPPGIPEAALRMPLRLFWDAEITGVDLALSPDGKAMLLAAQERVVTALDAEGKMPPSGVQALEITACLDPATGIAGIAAVTLRLTGERLPLPDECD